MVKLLKIDTFDVIIRQNGDKFFLFLKFFPIFKIQKKVKMKTHLNNRFSPFEDCSAQCRLTYNSSDLEIADVILFHLHKMTKSDAIEISLISKTQCINKNQVWVFLTDESPVHTVIWPEYKNLFNWSMTYRSDSDVLVPYGRTIPRKLSKNVTEILQKMNENLKNKTKLVAVMGSNCSANKNSGSSRWKYVKSLSTILKINNNSYYQLDIIGRCLNGNLTVCPGHFKSDCKNLNNYKFYLSFENSNCPEYLTEKLYWNAYSKYNIPVIMGPQKKDCKKLLPPNSFIHVKDFNSPELLIDYLIYLNNNEEKYLEYHNWRMEFDVINEHGYFGSASKHYCRLCEAFFFRDKKKKKIYNDIQQFWNKQECSYDL